MEEMAEQYVICESPIPKLESSLDDLKLGSEIVKVEQNMILMWSRRERAVMTVPWLLISSSNDNSVNFGTYP